MHSLSVSYTFAFSIQHKKTNEMDRTICNNVQCNNPPCKPEQCDVSSYCLPWFLLVCVEGESNISWHFARGNESACIFLLLLQQLPLPSLSLFTVDTFLFSLSLLSPSCHFIVKISLAAESPSSEIRVYKCFCVHSFVWISFALPVHFCFA